MSETSDRYRKVAAGFTERAAAVPADAWDNPTPCEGWVARDIVRHMAEWMPPMFLGSVGVPLPEIPSPDDDPLGAWLAVDAALQAALDDPDIAQREVDMHIGLFPVEGAIGQFALGDVLVHTWDLARATGLDERLDPDEVHSMAQALDDLGDVLEQSGQYAKRVEVPADADEQTRLIAFTGRQP